MAKATAGLIVKYTRKDGGTQMAIMRHVDQKDEFKKVKKAFLRLIDDNYRFKTDEHNKEVVALKSIDLLTQIGHID